MWNFKNKSKDTSVKDISSKNNWILLVYLMTVKNNRYSKPNPFREIENDSQTIYTQSWRDSFIKMTESKPHIKMSKLNEIRKDIANMNKVPINSVVVTWADYVIGDEVFLESLNDVGDSNKTNDNLIDGDELMRDYVRKYV